MKEKTDFEQNLEILLVRGVEINLRPKLGGTVEIEIDGKIYNKNTEDAARALTSLTETFVDVLTAAPKLVIEHKHLD